MIDGRHSDRGIYIIHFNWLGIKDKIKRGRGGEIQNYERKINKRIRKTIERKENR